MKNFNIYKIYNLKSRIRIDKFLSKNINFISRTNIKKLILENNVTINSINILDPSYKLKTNEIIKIIIPIKKKIYYKNNNLDINILYEDNDLLIINKQSGVVIYDECLNIKNSLINSLLSYYPKLYKIKKLGIVHRLDKNTTGIMIIAKSELSYINLKKMFLYRKIIKEYNAIVSGKLISGGTINLPISRSNINKKIMMINFYKGKNSITHYKIINRFNLHTHIKLRIETGRTHQIRVHMSHIGNPIVGDLMYGKNNSNFKKSMNFLKNININFNGFALHSSKLIFNHPINNNKLNISAKFPNNLKLLLKNI